MRGKEKENVRVNDQRKGDEFYRIYVISLLSF
jgi:hypothetical protein